MDVDMGMIGLAAVLLHVVHFAMISNTRVDDICIVMAHVDRGDSVQVSLVSYAGARWYWGQHIDLRIFATSETAAGCS